MALRDRRAHPAGGVRQHRNILENFTACILHGTPLIAPMEEGIRGLELGNAILLSGLKDRTVSLPIDAAEFAAELEKLIAAGRCRKKESASGAAVDAGFGESFGSGAL